MASEILKWANTNLPGTDTENITILCNNCYGQNKNISMVIRFYFLLNKYPQINKKFS